MFASKPLCKTYTQLGEFIDFSEESVRKFREFAERSPNRKYAVISCG